MRVRPGLLSLAILASAFSIAADAQVMLPMQLPKNDFVWTWGKANAFEGTRAREDFSVVGTEAGFRCELTGRMSLSRGTSPTEMRELEAQLQASLFFIQDSANLMYRLDTYREIDWAMLDCKTVEANETEADLQEREDKARERAERRRERRREKEAD
jgi:hypothetical protein